MENTRENKSTPTFTDLLRTRFKGILDPLGNLLNRIGLMPNTMTILGLAGNVAGAVLIASGELVWGGIIILLMGPVDALDGTMARLRGMAGQFGAFVDSVSDRYSELIILGGLIFFYLKQGDAFTALLVYAAAAGSVLVSYIRSRGQSLGWDTKIGILTRVERYLLLGPSLVLSFISPLIPMIGVGLIAVLANVTAIQRIYDVRRQAKSDQ